MSGEGGEGKPGSSFGKSLDRQIRNTPMGKAGSAVGETIRSHFKVGPEATKKAFGETPVSNEEMEQLIDQSAKPVEPQRKGLLQKALGLVQARLHK